MGCNIHSEFGRFNHKVIWCACGVPLIIESIVRSDHCRITNGYILNKADIISGQGIDGIALLPVFVINDIGIPDVIKSIVAVYCHGIAYVGWNIRILCIRFQNPGFTVMT